ncbi:MAG: alpha-amylase family protein [Propionibacteriaceae bacterium]|nr:alpha-amylase family protein [Propionibacteriaceae bacterium]
MDDSTLLDLRFDRYGARLRDSLRAVYGERADETYDRACGIIAAAAAARPEDLKRLDEARLLRPDWLQDASMIGYVAYTERFSGTLRGIADRLDYLEDLGVTYLHLMPLLQPRDGDSDGGYAVQDYRAVRPDLGTMDDLAWIAAQLRARGISLVVDLVLNHVAREHAWARRARAGEAKYRNYFYIYDDRGEPDRYESSLPEVFPDFAPGNFTWDEETHGWVWTTFNSFQWDVNWSNPDVFCEYLEIICHLANHGAEVIRLDAIAFIWKRLGTNCQGQPEVHHLTAALRAALRIAAPAVAFKAEAIVGPEELLPYLGQGSNYGLLSDMAYHNSLMVQLWSSLASRDTRLFEVALNAFAPKPPNTTWATYVRCHDDIGWAVSDADAARAHLNGAAHRSFLSDFYAGVFPGSFAEGLVFQYNPATNDRRISGSAASLAGFDSALHAGDTWRTEEAIGRLLLLYAVILGFGGVPLLYMGDEIGLGNDLAYAEDPAHAADNRWAHRPVMDWAAAAKARARPDTPRGRILAGLRRTIEVRKSLPHLHAGVEAKVVPSPDPRLLVLCRHHPLGNLVQVYNFSEGPAYLLGDILRERLGQEAIEALSGYEYSLRPQSILIAPYQALWLLSK